MEGMETAQLEEMGEEMMEEMMKKFEEMGEKVRLGGFGKCVSGLGGWPWASNKVNVWQCLVVERFPRPRGRHDAAAAVEGRDVRPHAADLRESALLLLGTLLNEILPRG